MLRALHRTFRLGGLGLALTGCGSQGSAVGEPGPAHALEPVAAAAEAPVGLPQPASVEVSDPEDGRLDRVAALIVAGDYPAADALLDAVMGDHPGHGRAELMRGLALHRRKRYALARPHFEAAIRRGPSFEGQAVAYYWMGWCCYYSGDLVVARAAFQRHLEHDPSEGDSQFGLGLVDLEEGRLDSARDRFAESIELHRSAATLSGQSRNAEIAKAHARIADVHVQRDEWALAREELERCIDLHPAHYTAYHKLHDVLVRLGEPGAERALQLHELWKRRAQGS